MKLFTNGSGILYNALPWGIKIARQRRLLISFFVSSLLLISGKAISQSADLDQGENGSASSPKAIFWQNGNLGPSGAHFAEGYSVPYRAKVAGLVGNASTPHTLIIEWDTKDQNGHALDYITYFDNLDNPSGSHQANFSHAKEVVNPTLLTTFSGSPTLFQIPTPSSTGAEVAGMPGASFTALPTNARTGNANATKMAIWGGTIDSLVYIKQDNQDATTASTKTQLKISFKSTNGNFSTVLLAWGGHIAAEYDWGTGRGASKVSGSPYHMRVITIDGKPGGQDRSLKATAVFVPPPSCAVTAAQTVCQGSSGTLTYSYTGPTSGITNYSWTLTPSTTNAKISGTAAGVNTISGANVTSVNIVPTTGTTYQPGTFTLSLTVTNLGGTAPPCTTTGIVNTAATADAGPDQTVCSSSPTVTLAGSVGGGATSGTWSGGTGTFNPNATTLTATYTPSAAEITAGTVTLTLTTNDPTGPCAAVTNDMVITINPGATSNAGPDQTVCSSSPNVTLAGSVGGGATSGTWTGGGGTFNPNATTLTATYTPSAAEITAGTVTLTLLSNDPSGPCAAASNDMIITINPAATSNAGPDQTVCSSSPQVTLAGSVGGGASSGTWSGGTGTFDPNATTLTAKYTPSAAEITAGTVTLTLTTNDPAGICNAVSNDMIITINPAATANAGPDQTVCSNSPQVTLAGSVGGGAASGTWSGGSGTFDPNTTTLTAKYTPSAAEITAGTVTLTLTTNDPAGICNAVSNDMIITINPAATANAGPDQAVCASSPQVTLAGQVNGGASTGTWSGGTGIFDPNANTLNAKYTPSAAEIAAGTVTLTLTSNDPTGPCGTASNDMVITIAANPSRPNVVYIAPDCDETTFGIKVIAAVPGGTYTLTQVNGVGTVVKTTAVHADAQGNILFSGLTIGKGFSIVVKVGDCTSPATDCDNYKDEIITAKKPVVQQSAKEVAVAGTKVTAAPNPFNEKIRFSITPTTTGRASLELYNLLGEKVKTVFNGQVQKGQVQTIEYNVPFSQRTTLIYLYRSGNEKVSGKLIGLR